MELKIILLLILSYLTGSIATAVWYGRLFFNIDVREHGSGNAGATNTFRVLGRKAGTVVFVIDVLKGFAATQLIHLFSFEVSSDYLLLIQVLAGMFAVAGHIFPVFAGFRGGKGVATLLGMSIGILPVPSLIAAGIFIVIFLISGYVSLGSLLAGLTFPILVLFIFHYSALPVTIFVSIIPVIVFITHHKNVKRLIKGEENRFNFGKRNR